MLTTLLELAGVALATVGAAFIWGPWAIAVVLGTWLAYSAAST